MHEAFEVVSCNLCGHNDTTTLYPSTLPQDLSLKITERFAPSDHSSGHDTIVRCNVCGLVYVNPRMKPNLIWQGYSEAVDEKYATQAEQRMGTFQRTLKKIEEYVPNKGRLLDIGCAAGFFLKVAQDADWSVEGIEPNRGLAEWGQKKYGLPIKTVDFLNSNYPPASFEVITFWDVLEHVHDPRAYLHEAYSILKPGGFIFINFPDFGSRLARIFGEKWWFLSPVHIYYFDRRTLKKMMEDEGYDVKVMMAHSQTLSLGYLFKRFADYSKFISNVGMKVSAALRIDQLPIRYYASQALAVAKKPDRS